jgi:hypothetical protein
MSIRKTALGGELVAFMRLTQAVESTAARETRKPDQTA